MSKDQARSERTIEERAQELQADLMLYVVDKRQSLHFEQLFRAAQKTGISGKAELKHLPFGTVNGPDGKPFKTRAGGVMRLKDLIAMAKEEALKEMEQRGVAAELDEGERQEIARRVGLAALKFADLSNNRTSDYIFDLGKFTSFEGRTGPYILYSAVRIKSILRKAQEKTAEPGPLLPPTEVDRALMLLLCQLPDVVATAASTYMPHHLCDFAYRLAQTFSVFYNACPRSSCCWKPRTRFSARSQLRCSI